MDSRSQEISDRKTEFISLTFAKKYIEVIFLSTRKVKVDGEDFEVKLEKTEGIWKVEVNGTSFEIEVDSSRNKSLGGRKKKKRVGGKKSGIISSSIPGKIVSISVDSGDAVKEGDVVMIIEAMKMQNEIHAPLTGIISSINCKTGDNIEANSPLILITPEEKK